MLSPRVAAALFLLLCASRLSAAPTNLRLPAALSRAVLPPPPPFSSSGQWDGAKQGNAPNAPCKPGNLVALYLFTHQGCAINEHGFFVRVTVSNGCVDYGAPVSYCRPPPACFKPGPYFYTRKLRWARNCVDNKLRDCDASKGVGFCAAQAFKCFPEQYAGPLVKYAA